MEKDETKNKRTLSLCDGCILVGIVVLIASIARPPVSQAFQEKKLVQLADHLAAVRAQIRMYKTETGVYPGQQHPGDLSITSDEFTVALEQWRVKNEELQLQALGANPYVSDTDAACEVTCVSDPEAYPMGIEGTGWWFNAATGEFAACDSAFHTNY